jgi:hypothetical protein
VTRHNGGAELGVGGDSSYRRNSGGGGVAVGGRQHRRGGRATPRGRDEVTGWAVGRTDSATWRTASGVTRTNPLGQ